MFNRKDFEKYAQGHHNTDPSYLQKYLNNTPKNITRTVLEESSRPLREMHIGTKLIEQRTIVIGEEISFPLSNLVVPLLLYLDATDSEKDINLYINSPGGSIYAGLAIYDTMKHIKSDISITNIGLAASMGAVLLSGGTPGKRFALPHSRVMIHQPMGSAQGTSTHMETTMNELLSLREDVYKILAKNTNNDYKTIENASKEDNWMKAPEAKKFGIIDEVLYK